MHVRQLTVMRVFGFSLRIHHNIIHGRRTRVWKLRNEKQTHAMLFPHVVWCNVSACSHVNAKLQMCNENEMKNEEKGFNYATNRC